MLSINFNNLKFKAGKYGLLLTIIIIFSPLFSPLTSSAKTLHELALKGRRMFKEGKLLKAQHFFREALKAYPGNPQIQNNLGVVLKKTFHFNEAEKCFRTAISIAPWYQEAYFNLASLHIFLRQRKKAFEIFRTAVNEGASKVDWGFFFYDNQSFLDAKKVFYEYTQLHRKDFLGYYGLGITYFSLKENGPALSELSEAKKLSPNNPRILDALGVVKTTKGDNAEGEKYFKEALSYSFIPSGINLVRLYRKENRISDSKKMLTKLTSQYLSSNSKYRAEIENLLGEFLYIDEEKEKAAHHFKQAKELGLNAQKLFLYNQGREFENKGNFEKAIESYGEALKIYNDACEIWFRLGLCNFYIDRFQGALDAYSEVGKQRKDYLLDYFIGICYKDMKKWEQAVHYLELSIKKKNNAKSHLALALIYKRLGKRKAAVARFNNLLFMEPRNSYAKKQIIALGGIVKPFLEGNVLSQPIYPTDQKNKIAKSVNTETIEEKKIVKTVNVKINTTAFTPLPVPRLLPLGKTSMLLPAEKQKNKKSYYFSLQLFSSKKRQDAEKLLSKLRKKGYNVVIVHKEIKNRGLWYRVRLGEFDVLKDAKAAGKELKEKEKLNFWISKNKR